MTPASIAAKVLPRGTPSLAADADDADFESPDKFLLTTMVTLVAFAVGLRCRMGWAAAVAAARVAGLIVEVAVAVAFGAAKTRDRHRPCLAEADAARRASDREVAMFMASLYILCCLMPLLQ